MRRQPLTQAGAQEAVGRGLAEEHIVITGLQAVGQRDLAVVQAVVLLLVWAVLLINFLVDVAYQVVDPRLRRTAEAPA